ncbi:MAG: hypothetical protein ACRC6O_13390 [Flavobacterium sp.]
MKFKIGEQVYDPKHLSSPIGEIIGVLDTELEEKPKGGRYAVMSSRFWYKVKFFHRERWVESDWLEESDLEASRIVYLK